jgi:hypothetical protein
MRGEGWMLEVTSLIEPNYNVHVEDLVDVVIPSNGSQELIFYLCVQQRYLCMCFLDAYAAPDIVDCINNPAQLHSGLIYDYYHDHQLLLLAKGKKLECTMDGSDPESNDDVGSNYADPTVVFCPSQDMESGVPIGSGATSPTLACSVLDVPGVKIPAHVTVSNSQLSQGNSHQNGIQKLLKGQCLLCLLQQHRMIHCDKRPRGKDDNICYKWSMGDRCKNPPDAKECHHICMRCRQSGHPLVKCPRLR